jgi:hypothetical protein
VVKLGIHIAAELPRVGDVNCSMPPFRKQIVLCLLTALVLAPSLFAQTLGQNVMAGTSAATPKSESSPAPHHAAHKKHKAPQPLVLPPMPAGPLSQLPMDQLPPAPAKVSFEDGLLAISAQNSTLGQILRDVKKLTGATIDIPQGSGANERVVTSLGPGAPRDVLSSLLNGSSFDYVMLGSNTDPGAVSSIILTSKQPGAGGPGPEPQQTAANVYQNNNPAVQDGRFPPQPFNRQVIAGQPQPGQPPQPGAAAEDDSKDDDADNSDDNKDDDQAQPGQNGQQPGAAAPNGQDQAQSNDPNQQNQPNAGPKTPEQILDMLRRQQQQPGALINPQQSPQNPPDQQ